MKIEFTVTPTDIWSIMKHERYLWRTGLWANVSRFWTILFTVPLCVLLVIPATLFVANLPAGMGFWLAYLVLVLGALWFVLVTIHKKRILRFIGVRLERDNAYAIALSEHGIELSTIHSSSTVSWEGINDIAEISGYVLFVQHFYSCIFIPTRAFTTKEEMERFLAEARSLMKTALNNRLQRIAESAR